MKVAALIPTYNRRQHVQRAIDSVLRQTLPVAEIIVVDDGSTDGTAEFLQARYGARIRVVRQENGGVSGARRRLVQEATAEWLAFLDSDDEWPPRRNEQFCSFCESLDQDVAWVFGNVRVVRDERTDETIFEKYGLTLNGAGQVFDDSLQVQFPFQFGLLQASIIRRSALLELNCFSEGLKHSEDVLAGFQVAVRYRYAAIPEIVAHLYRTSDLRASSTELGGMNSEDYSRARMRAFRLVAESGKRHPWGERYAEAVRGLCKIKARQQAGAVRGDSCWRLSLEQFRFSVSARSMTFFACCLLGWPGLRLCAAAGQGIRSFLAACQGIRPGMTAPRCL